MAGGVEPAQKLLGLGARVVAGIDHFRAHHGAGVRKHNHTEQRPVPERVDHLIEALPDPVETGRAAPLLLDHADRHIDQHGDALATRLNVEEIDRGDAFAEPRGAVAGAQSRTKPLAADGLEFGLEGGGDQLGIHLDLGEGQMRRFRRHHARDDGRPARAALSLAHLDLQLQLARFIRLGRRRHLEDRFGFGEILHQLDAAEDQHRQEVQPQAAQQHALQQTATPPREVGQRPAGPGTGRLVRDGSPGVVAPVVHASAGISPFMRVFR